MTFWRSIMQMPSPLLRKQSISTWTSETLEELSIFLATHRTMGKGTLDTPQLTGSSYQIVSSFLFFFFFFLSVNTLYLNGYSFSQFLILICALDYRVTCFFPFSHWDLNTTGKGNPYTVTISTLIPHNTAESFPPQPCLPGPWCFGVSYFNSHSLFLSSQKAILWEWFQYLHSTQRWALSNWLSQASSFYFHPLV